MAFFSSSHRDHVLAKQLASEEAGATTGAVGHLRIGITSEQMQLLGYMLRDGGVRVVLHAYCESIDEMTYDMGVPQNKEHAEIILAAFAKKPGGE